MKHITQLMLVTAVIAVTLPMASASRAQAAPAAAEAAKAVEMTDAEVRKVDAAARKITLKHGEIKSLDMPPMTMVFQVKDAALLEGLQAGDRIRFAAVKANGNLVVTAIERSK